MKNAQNTTTLTPEQVVQIAADCGMDFDDEFLPLVKFSLWVQDLATDPETQEYADECRTFYAAQNPIAEKNSMLTSLYVAFCAGLCAGLELGAALTKED